MSVYADGAAAPTGFIGRITTVNSSTSIDISLTAIAGTRPATAASGVTATVGGAWLGPNGASGFPFAFAASTMTNSTGETPRINFKNGTNYAVTSAVSHALNGPIIFQGYTSAAGDGGKFTLDGGTSVINILTCTGIGCDLVDAIVSNNGASGNNYGISWTGSRCRLVRVVVHDIRGWGIIGGASNTCIECEAYLCNVGNQANGSGFRDGNWIRCVAHDNAGTNSSGFVNCLLCVDCIADTNGQNGFRTSSALNVVWVNCDSYNNVGDGMGLSGAGTWAVIENCNLVKNGGWGINASGATGLSRITNCGFGSGTQVNTSGATTFAATSPGIESGSVTYAANVTPWKDPANGDFSLNLPAALNVGRGTFTETAASYTGTVGYPPIGAAPPRIFRPLRHPGMSGGMRG